MNDNSHAHQNNEPAEATPLLVSTAPYSVFSKTQKRLIILTAALTSSFSPLSANIYYPALNSIAKDLQVSPSQINLTITTLLIGLVRSKKIGQAIAPTFIGSRADQSGRRSAYICCFVIYIAGNMALAIQHSFPALLILRAVQSCGSSGTVALASAVVADVITSAERGAYMEMASLLLSPHWGRQSIFWFLVLLASAVFIPLLLFFPETCRAIVGNGSIQPRGWIGDQGIGLCFLPAGLGSFLSATANGILVDWNYRRSRLQANQSLDQTRKQDVLTFPIERARLQVGLPMFTSDS
ncbi:hypothetical protein N7448_004404 [Penicillium atrosanguineum]|uniref:Uncharacterized protein n=1 Tax=Penicillium atrosanguineum TaxID=1132637 RepID=A0A9W9H9I1_9EURO|nr:hypothetical protein N7448_004404 [Penicillium atrosanguineum]KAJ5316432.1 hypothetical protein N7476_006739 [Penicillium atrosanguineum]